MNDYVVEFMCEGRRYIQYIAAEDKDAATDAVMVKARKLLNGYPEHLHTYRLYPNNFDERLFTVTKATDESELSWFSGDSIRTSRTHRCITDFLSEEGRNNEIA